ncbi:D-glycero-beta-D-manno-heptose 1,7-bisphosphate 7-phosphatase [Desulfosarcina ovata]|uniref:D,D-heptose 1,7-bisphosphate phosphatase n=1 Tax=Desulfosarcina ovata subsp. ovata TaxID=2752305 RepID=A0A5K8A9U9_9BACT|nr:D-glycero-beta-D-manno-heptose 1,7-bisphosphate 7-phosphatase [Desulfosarcina ovata]BBO89238.1 D,D-heptose 1,7-bisphosphate phosphatase [Desulfosarcina ovata subsp. ovata]
MPIQTVFLDRDGVINVDSPDYIKCRDEFHPIPGSLAAIGRLTRGGLNIIVITNQSVINRGMVPLRELQAIHDKLHRLVAEHGGRITDIFFCPHRPDENCDCRKPKPGLIERARERYAIDLSRAVMVGDSAKDILAGKAAGCGRTVLVQTGNGPTAMRTLEEAGQRPDHIAADLAAAADWILAHGDA